MFRTEADMKQFTTRQRYKSSSVLRAGKEGSRPKLDTTITLPVLPSPRKLIMSLEHRSVSPFSYRTPSPLTMTNRLVSSTPLSKYPGKLLVQSPPTLLPSSSAALKFPNLSSSHRPLAKPDSYNLKRWLRKQLLKHYQVKIGNKDLKQMNEAQMCAFALQKRRLRRGKAAAQTMVKWLRTKTLEKAVKVQRAQMHIAALRIQRQWKKYKVNSNKETVKRPKELLKKRTFAAIDIQRTYRGYLAREHWKAMKLMSDVDKMHQYYSGIKQAIQREKGLKILMKWRRFKLKQRISKRIEAKLQAKKIAEEQAALAQSKWDFKPIIKKADPKRSQLRLAAERPTSIKTNPSWKQKVEEQEPRTAEVQTPVLQRSKNSPGTVEIGLKRSNPGTQNLANAMKRAYVFEAKTVMTPSTEPSTPMSSGVETRVRGDRERLGNVGLDKIDEVEI